MKISLKKHMAVIAIFIVIAISFVNVSARTYELSVESSSVPQTILNSFVSNNVPHYDFKIGYVNFSQHNHIVSFVYMLRPFNGLNPVDVGSAYYSAKYAVSSNLAIIEVYQVISIALALLFPSL